MWVSYLKLAYCRSKAGCSLVGVGITGWICSRLVDGLISRCVDYAVLINKIDFGEPYRSFFIISMNCGCKLDGPCWLVVVIDDVLHVTIQLFK